MYYTYVLQSEKDGKFYLGFTEDLKQRFELHNKGRVDSTKDRRPLLYPMKPAWKGLMQQDAKNTLKLTRAGCFLKEGSNLISLGKSGFPAPGRS